MNAESVVNMVVNTEGFEMQFNVSRTDIEESAELLEQLEMWERLTKISGHYNRGEVTLSIDGNCGKSRVATSVDMYGLEHHKQDTAVNRCHQELGRMLAAKSTDIAKAAVEIIKSHMPLPLEATGLR